MCVAEARSFFFSSSDVGTPIRISSPAILQHGPCNAAILNKPGIWGFDRDEPMVVGSPASYRETEKMCYSSLRELPRTSGIVCMWV